MKTVYNTISNIGPIIGVTISWTTIIVNGEYDSSNQVAGEKLPNSSKKALGTKCS